MPGVSIEEKTKSRQFVDALGDVMDIIEEVKEYIPEGAYLHICNKLKISYDFKDYINNKINELRTNPVVQEHTRRMNRPTLRRHLLTDAEKLKKGWKLCPKCDRLVLDLQSHKARNICAEINDTKKLSANTGKSQTNDLAKAVALVHKFRYKKGLIRNIT
tara:strand:- start:32 stop:511 length:480 start_codon:yes stop_codon:yes gene_type:complete